MKICDILYVRTKPKTEKNILLMFSLAREVDEMITAICDKAAITVADTAAPHNYFSQPGMQLVLRKVAEFRAETNAGAVEVLMKKLSAQRQTTNRIEDLSDRFMNVSKVRCILPMTISPS